MPAKKQYRKKRNQQYKGKRFRPARSVPDKAALTENYALTYPTPTGWNANQMYVKRDFTIAANPRAAAVAAAYQHYRIKKITLVVRPQVDTFVGGGAVGGYTIPNFYYMIDKAGSLPNTITLAAIKSMGAKPIRLDDKMIKISWRPSVLQNVVDAGAAPLSLPVSYKVSPWLSTNENALQNSFVCSSTDHLGIFWYVETTGVSSLQYTVEAILDVEYKKPLNATNTGDTSAVQC